MLRNQDIKHNKQKFKLFLHSFVGVLQKISRSSIANSFDADESYNIQGDSFNTTGFEMNSVTSGKL